MQNRTDYSILLVILTIVTACENVYERQFLIRSSEIEPLNESELAIHTSFADKAPYEIQSYGYCWAISPNPTIEDDTTNYIAPITAGFTGSVKRLSFDVEYYVRAYVVDTRGVSYGNELSILNNYFPPISGTRLSGIGANFFEVQSQIDLRPTQHIVDYGHVWSTNESPTIADDTTSFGKLHVNAGIFSYTSKLRGLSNNQRYYVRGYYFNDQGRSSYGPQIVLNIPDTVLAGQWREEKIPDEGDIPVYYCVLQIDNDIFYFTGNHGENYPYIFYNTTTKTNLTTGETSTLNDFPGELRAFTKGFVIDKKAYVGFGINYPDGPGFNDLWQYNPQTGSWIQRKRLPVFDGHVIATTALDNYGYALVNRRQILELWKYDAATDAWERKLTKIPHSGYPTICNGLIGHDKMLYFQAGDAVAQFDTSDNSLLTIGNLRPFSFFIYNHKLFAITKNYKVYQWDSEHRLWLQKATMPAGRRMEEDGSEIFSTVLIDGMPVTGVYLYPQYGEYIPDYSLWFKYSEK